MVKDPVCGSELDPNSAAWKSEYMGKTYYFCCNGCKRTFDREPQKFTGAVQGPPSGHHH